MKEWICFIIAENAQTRKTRSKQFILKKAFAAIIISSLERSNDVHIQTLTFTFEEFEIKVYSYNEVTRK